MKLALVRTSHDVARTLGTLTVGNAEFSTMERPWIENEYGPGGASRISCVPPGVYLVQPHSSARFPGSYAITNPDLGVWYQPFDIPRNLQYGRSAILIHQGNFVHDVIGCIAIGKEHGQLMNEPAVLRSAVAMRELNVLLQRNHHTLEIT